MIPIKNIYYMLSYAFQSLKELDVSVSSVESFDNVQKLCAEILINGMNNQIKRGINKEYVPETETLSSVKGKIEVSDTIKSQAIIRRQVVCTHDEFTINSRLNQIIKATLKFLIKTDISTEQRKQIRKILILLDEVEDNNVYDIDWNLQYNRNNSSYQLLIVICYFVIKGLLRTEEDGSTKVLDLFDEQRMSRLYEKFILEYYKKHYTELSASASYISWQLDNSEDTMLPIMKSDIMLQKDNRVLIIDAKYYSYTTQKQFNKNTIHSGNLYQIFTYVKNKEFELRNKEHEVAGMLLYAKTDEEIQPDSQYSMSGNKIVIKTLDLNQDFSHISNSLDKIVSDYYGIY